MLTPQVESGAQIIHINMDDGHAGRRAGAPMGKFCRLIATGPDNDLQDTPLCIDSSKFEVPGLAAVAAPACLSTGHGFGGGRGWRPHWQLRASASPKDFMLHGCV